MLENALSQRPARGRQAHAPSWACTARRRFTWWRIDLEWVCVSPVRAQPSSYGTGGCQCARCQGGPPSCLGRTHCAGPRTQDRIRV